MLSVLLGTLVTRATQRADREGDGSITGDEWKALVSEQVGEMHSVIAEAGFAYYQSESTITATGAASYALPTDHMATWAVHLVVDSAGHRRELAELQPADRVRFLGHVGQATHFIVVGQNVELYPTPSTGAYKLVYIPQPADLSTSADSTSVDVVNTDGLAFVVWGVAVKARSKIADDVVVHMAERDAARARLWDWAVQRSFSNPRHAEPAEAPGGWYR
jgi:hypothetical protein